MEIICWPGFQNRNRTGLFRPKILAVQTGHKIGRLSNNSLNATNALREFPVMKTDNETVIEVVLNHDRESQTDYKAIGLNAHERFRTLSGTSLIQAHMSFVRHACY
jgi:hypothetical protein